VQTEQSRLVWLVGPDGKATMRPVQTANWIGSRWVVTGGLKPGEQIIVDNLMKLRPGAPVQPRTANGAAGSNASAASPGKAPPSAPAR
jgi:membrane fusion protein (multidrug efflux system)